MKWIPRALLIGIILFALVETVSFSRARYEIPRLQRVEALDQLVQGRELSWVASVLRDAGVGVQVTHTRGPRTLWPEVVDALSRHPETGGRGPITLVVTRSARPRLRLPSRATAPCRPDPVREIPPLGSTGQGKSPFFLGGASSRGVLRYNSSRDDMKRGAAYVYIVAAPSYSGPLLVRGGRLDGRGRLLFRQAAAHGGNGAALLGGPHEMHFPSGDGVRMWEAKLTFSAPGCYGLQVDGTGISRVITFEARPRA